jgi:predicted acylesterase/phospholipase RssA
MNMVNNTIVRMTDMENKDSLPQRALILQGGGALGAYNAGAFKALYEKLTEEDNLNKREGRPLFDIVAGTSSGAMNGSILVSHVIEKGTWKGSVQKLKAFWDYVSIDPDLRYSYPYRINKRDWIAFWNNQKEIDLTAASGEAARRYYSAKQFLCSGVPRVYLPEFSTPCLPFNGFPQPDGRFFDNYGFPNNTWYIYSNQPLKESMGKFARFPIATTYDKESTQPRLLLVGVDVQEGVAVTFDSYAKDDQNTTWESGYGTMADKNNADGNGDSVGQDKRGKELRRYKISYPGGIILDFVMASGSVPINYQYAKIDDVDALKLIDSQGNPVFEKTVRYFWDGGLLSNTPLRELIQSHKDYWFDVMGKGNDNAPVPDLEVYIINVWPTREEIIQMDHDGAKDRKEDILLNDKTDSDEKNANIVSDYISLVKKLVDLARANKIKDEDINNILSAPIRSRHRSGGIRTYKNLINGRFEINVKRIERTRGIENDISNKMLDYSTDTVHQLIEDGYNDTIDMFRLWGNRSG